MTKDSGIFHLELTEVLKNENIVTQFTVNKTTCCLEGMLNHVYSNNCIITRVYRDWTKTLDTFATRAGNKGISREHVAMLTDTLDNNYESILRFVYEEDEIRNGSNALGLVNEKVVELFLDETKTPHELLDWVII